jgi:leader peptidase (prepilin peptidase) / N-methyltransferase
LSRALVIWLGAVIGLSSGFAAKSLVKRIDSESRKFSSRIVVVTFVIGAVVSDLIFLRFSEIELRLCFAILCSGLLVQSLIDFFTHRLVRQISHAMAVSGTLLLSLNAVKNSNFGVLISAGICAAFGAAVSIISNKISSGSLGAGDVRLMAVLGWHLGFLSYSTAIWALFSACLLAGLFGVMMIVLRRGSWQQRIAFGPFLSLGSLVAIFVNEVSSYAITA